MARVFITSEENEVQRVTYTKLAAAFDNDALAESSLRRIQRLIAECIIDADLIAKLILKLIPVKGRYNLSLDRTNWEYSDTNINILTLGVIYDGMAFPVVYTMMNKRGNSHTEERIELVNRFIRLAGEDSIQAPKSRTRMASLNCRYLSRTAMQRKRLRCTA